MTHRFTSLARLPLCAALVLGSPWPAVGQEPTLPRQAAPPTAPPPQSPSAVSPSDEIDERLGADAIRRRLQELLSRLPPPVAQALRHDPSLLSNAAYLAPFPALGAFVGRHVEVTRNPGFFVGEAVVREWTTARASIEMFEGILGGLAVLTGMSVFAGLVAWLVRTVIDHRKWLRLARVQSDVHTKLLDRMASNEDLLAYIQTSPGRRFLESAPITLDGDQRPTSAPLSRIVWSMQTGVVLGALGIGLYVAQRQVPTEVAQGLGLMGTIVLSLGVGFVLAAMVAYAITSKAGLMPAPRPAGHE